MKDEPRSSEPERLIASSFKPDELRILFDNTHFQEAVTAMRTVEDAKKVIQNGARILSGKSKNDPA
jgi:hypothetical protein